MDGIVAKINKYIGSSDTEVFREIIEDMRCLANHSYRQYCVQRIECVYSDEVLIYMKDLPQGGNFVLIMLGNLVVSYRKIDHMAWYYRHISDENKMEICNIAKHCSMDALSAMQCPSSYWRLLRISIKSARN